MRSSRPAVGSWFLLALALAACGRGDDSGDEGGWVSVVDTLGTGAVRLTHAPPSAPGPAATLREELRIGSGDSSDAIAFGAIKGIEVLDDGRIAVLDAMAKEVRLFNASGDLLEVVGQAGQGPEEFGEPFGLMQDAAGRLWVPDYGNARMAVLDPGQGFVASFPLQLLSRGFVWNGAMSRDGRILVPSITLGPPRGNILRVYDASMNQVDSLPLPDTEVRDPRNQPGAFYWEAPGGRGMGFFQIPFFPMGQRLLDPAGGVWSTEAGDGSYRVKHWAPGGDTLLVIQANRTSLTIPTAERDSAIASVRERLQRFGGADQDYSRVPTVRPAVLSIILSDEGQLWVETPNPLGGTLYDRYDRGGAFLGSVSGSLRLAPGLRPFIRGEYLWAALTDDLDVPYVARFRIIQPVPPA